MSMFNPHFYSRLLNCSEISMETVGWLTFTVFASDFVKKQSTLESLSEKSSASLVMFTYEVMHVTHADCDSHDYVNRISHSNRTFSKRLIFIRSVNVCSISMWYEARDSVWTQAEVGLIKFNVTETLKKTKQERTLFKAFYCIFVGLFCTKQYKILPQQS